MAFKNKNLAVMAFAQSFTWWQYYAPDEFFDDIVNDSTYFLPVRHLMNSGDIIAIVAKDGTGVRWIGVGKDAIGLFTIK